MTPKTKPASLKIDTFIGDLHKSANTAKAYRYSLIMFEQFLEGRAPNEDEARAFIRHLVENRELASATVARHGYALRHFFKWRREPIFLEIPTLQRKLKPWMEMDDILKLVGVARDPFEKALIMVLFDTAIRISELRGLKKKDIDWEKGFIFIHRKGGRETWSPIGATALEALKKYDKWRTGNNFLFPFSYDYLRKEIIEIGKRAGMNYLRFHDFRHSRASTLRESDIPIEDIQALLGHANISTTLIYAQIKPQKLKERIPEAF